MTSSSHQASGPVWRKARRSTANGACVEVALARETVAVRDSKDPDGPVLRVSRSGFAAFLESTKKGEFDNIP